MTYNNGYNTCTEILLFFVDITYYIIVSTIENIEYYSSDIRVIQNIPTLYILSRIIIFKFKMWNVIDYP